MIAMIKKSGILIIDKENGLREWLLMLTQERYRLITEAVEKNQAVTVEQLVNEIGASAATIRRDLTALDELGKVKRIRGGAAAVEQEFLTSEDDVDTKYEKNVAEKKAIAEYAASTIQNDDFIYIDAGTTTEFLIDYIDISVSAVFVTNGIVHAKKLISKGFKTYMAGGLIRAKTEAVVGSEAVESIKKFNFTKSFIGANGIHPLHGFTTVDTDEAMLKKEAVNHSYVSYVLADHTKFGKVTAVTFAPLEKACIVTDGIVKDKYKELTLIKEVHVE